MLRFLMVFVGSVLALMLVGVSSMAAEDLRGAAGKVNITPEKPVYLAGYEINRRSSGVHDPLHARCLVLQSGGTRIAIVACDLIGLPRYEVQAMRARIKSVPPEHVYIAATHTHSGPDTMGQWGPVVTTSGVDAIWMASVRDRVVALVEETTAKLQPVSLRFASTAEVPKISKNSRVPQILDTELGVMQLVGRADNQPLCTFVNYACHPEVLDTHQISADFPHWLYETVEGAGNGVCLYLNGAQGGMVTADFDESTTPKGQNWPAAEALGRALGRRVNEIARTGTLLTEAPIRTAQRTFLCPLDNQKFKTLIDLKIFPRAMATETRGGSDTGLSIETEVNRFRIGPAEFVTVPGEALPNIGFYLKRQMQGSPHFVLGLCCDELGYILTPEDYGLQLYRYETGVSVGSQIEPLIVKRLAEIPLK